MNEKAQVVTSKQLWQESLETLMMQYTNKHSDNQISDTVHTNNLLEMSRSLRELSARTRDFARITRERQQERLKTIHLVK